MEEEPTWSVLAELPDGEIGYVDTNVVEGLRYWYRVCAFNGQGDSDYSNEDSARAVNYILILDDDFDPDLDPLQWESISGGTARQGPQGFFAGNALYFSGGNTRAAATIPLDTTKAATLSFQFRAGNFPIDGIFWDNSEADEQVALEYSNDGANWIRMSPLDTQYPALSTWTAFEVEIPAEAQTVRTSFRWRQTHHSGSGYDAWALDNVSIVSERPDPPPTPVYVFAVPNTDTQILLGWTEAPGASKYVIERQRAGEGWIELATVSSAHLFCTDTSALPSQLYGYRVKAVNAGGESPYSWTTMAHTYSQYEAWLLDNFGTSEPTGTAAPLALGSDGIANVMKYACNLDVGENACFLDASKDYGLPILWFDKASGRLVCEFVRRKSQFDPQVDYVVQFSDDLLEWQTVDNLLSAQSLSPTWERVRFGDLLDNSLRARFCRVLFVPAF